jgi:uncharacterized protein related to proFAR isomerase
MKTYKLIDLYKKIAVMKKTKLRPNYKPLSNSTRRLNSSHS